MVNYRRVHLNGGTYFITVTLKNRRSKLLTENIQLLRKALKISIQKYQFKIEAICILPDHMHLIIKLNEKEDSTGPCIQRLKSEFVKLLKRSSSVSFNHRSEADVWQRRFWEHILRDDNDYRRHVDYIHFNPLKHGLVKSVEDWPFSSFHKFKKKGLYSDNWCQDHIGISEGFD